MLRTLLALLDKLLLLLFDVNQAQLAKRCAKTIVITLIDLNKHHVDSLYLATLLPSYNACLQATHQCLTCFKQHHAASQAEQQQTQHALQHLPGPPYPASQTSCSCRRCL
jgi:hypothetical protein